MWIFLIPKLQDKFIRFTCENGQIDLDSVILSEKDLRKMIEDLVECQAFKIETEYICDIS